MAEIYFNLTDIAEEKCKFLSLPEVSMKFLASGISNKKSKLLRIAEKQAYIHKRRRRCCKFKRYSYDTEDTLDHHNLDPLRSDILKFSRNTLKRKVNRICNLWVDKLVSRLVKRMLKERMMRSKKRLCNLSKVEK